MIDWLSELFGINAHPIRRGLKYLGFQLKAAGYKKEDWGWLLDKYHKRISGWQYRYLSLGGRVILTQSVLNQMMVYWAHLFAFPTSIISTMNKLTTSFIWGDCAAEKKYHLSSLANLSKPKELGGWGLLDLKSFGKALLCRTLWRGVFEDGPWSDIIRGKYLRRRSLAHWLRRKQLGSPRGSPIWQSLRKIGMFFLENLSWHFQSGKNILIGKDCFIGGPHVNEIQMTLLNFFHRFGIFYWENLIAEWNDPIPRWKEADLMQMPTNIASLWDKIKLRLRNCGIFR